MGVPRAPVLADAAYGNDSQFREGLTKLGLVYVVGIQSLTTVWGPGQAPLPAKQWKVGDTHPDCCLGISTIGRSLPESWRGTAAPRLENGLLA